ncbi:MAG TPA: AsmA-like C-terminal domain-containing protein [Deltaproteobacteria bacterium]|nr:AsmA-like C-terminal domain-containing protein [Deltaproteobacteria bacterium]
MTNLSRKLLVAVILTACVVLVIISAFYTFIKLSPEQLQRIVEGRLEEITRRDVSIKTVTVQIFLRPKLSLMDVRIGDPDDLYASIKRVDAAISLRHLLTGETRLTNIAFHHPSVSVSTEALEKIQGEEGSTQWPSVLIVDGYMNVSHEDNELILKDINGSISKDKIDFHASTLGGTARIQAHFSSGWKGNISLDNLDLSSARYDLGGVCSLKTIFDLTGEKVDVSFDTRIRQFRLPWHREPLAVFSIGLKTRGTFNHVSLNEVSLEIPEGTITGSGEIIDLSKKRDAMLTLNMKSSDFDYERVVTLLPTHLFPPWLDDLLTRQIRDGRSKFSAIGYKGAVGGLFEAPAFFDNAYIVQNLTGQSFGSGHGPERITDITGEVIYGEGDIAFKGLNGLMGESVLDTVDLTFQDVALPGTKVSVAVTADMPADDFIKTWRAAMVTENLYRVLSSVKEVNSGRLQGHVKTYWDETSGGPLQASGNIAVEFLDLVWGDTVIQGLSGTVTAEDFSSPFDIVLAGKVNDLDVERFSCKLHDPFGGMRYEFSLKSGPPFQTESFSVGKGSTFLTEGTGTGPRIHARATLRADRFILFDATYSPTGESISATGTIAGTLWPEADIEFLDIKPQLPSSDLTISGKISEGKGDLHIQGSLDLTQLHATIDEKAHPLSGSVAGDMSIHWGDTTKLSGAVIFNQAMFCADGIPVVLEGPVRMSDDTLVSEDMKILAQDITIRITSGVLTLTGRPHFTGILLIDGVKVTSQGKGVSKLFTSLDGTAPIELTNLDLYGIPVDSMKAYAELKDGALDLSALYIQGASGTAHGSTSINTAGDSTFDVVISLKNANIRQYLNAMSEEESWIRGTMDLEGHLFGNTNSLNGSLVLTARDGKIQKYALFSRIFALLNVYKIIQSHDIELTSKNFPYNMITSTFTFKDSILSFDDFYFDSNSLQISAVGQYSLKTKEIDSILGVQPFEALDRTIGMLPLLGWILTGEDKKLIVVSMKVKGEIDDPTVQIAPWDTVSKPVKSSLLRAWELSTDFLKESRDLLPNGKD